MKNIVRASLAYASLLTLVALAQFAAADEGPLGADPGIEGLPIEATVVCSDEFIDGSENVTDPCVGVGPEGPGVGTQSQTCTRHYNYNTGQYECDTRSNGYYRYQAQWRYECRWYRDWNGDYVDGSGNRWSRECRYYYY